MSDAIVERGRIVSLTYVIRDQGGALFEYRDAPLAYVHGSGDGLFPRIEQSLEGHRVGDRVQVELAPSEGFGDYDPSLCFVDDIDNVPEQFRRLGAEVEMRNDRGESRLFYVTRMENGRLTADGNHPLAGQTVSFEITITGIRDAGAAAAGTGSRVVTPGAGPFRLQ